MTKRLLAVVGAVLVAGVFAAPVANAGFEWNSPAADRSAWGSADNWGWESPGVAGLLTDGPQYQ